MILTMFATIRDALRPHDMPLPFLSCPSLRSGFDSACTLFIITPEESSGRKVKNTTTVEKTHEEENLWGRASGTMATLRTEPAWTRVRLMLAAVGLILILLLSSPWLLLAGPSDSGRILRGRCPLRCRPERDMLQRSLWCRALRVQSSQDQARKEKERKKKK